MGRHSAHRLHFAGPEAPPTHPDNAVRENTMKRILLVALSSFLLLIAPNVFGAFFGAIAPVATQANR